MNDDFLEPAEKIKGNPIEIRERPKYYDNTTTITNTVPGLINTIDTEDVRYNREEINKFRRGSNAPKIWVVNDSEDDIFIRKSATGDFEDFSDENLVYPGDFKVYYNVYELRLRSPTAGAPYRVSEYEIYRQAFTAPIDISDRCSRLLGELCFAGSPIDPRAIRALNALTDSVTATISGTPNVDVIDRCARLLGTLCFGGIPIDPRQIRNLVFATDKVDVSGSSVTTASGSVSTMDDAFMEFRLMADYLKDLALAINPNNSTQRVSIEASPASVSVTGSLTTVSTVTNLAQIGGVLANGFIFDEMDIVWNTGIRPNII